MPVASRVGAVALVAAAICSAATLVRSPYLQDVTPESAIVLWTTREKGRGVVEYSADGVITRSVAAEVREFLPPAVTQPFYQYRADLRGLMSGREYLYRVLVDDEVLKDDLRFRTAGHGPFTFLVFGDSGTGGSDQARLARRMIEKEDPDLVLHVGDLSQDSGTFSQLESTYFRVYAPLMAGSPFYPTPGNHDYWTDDGRPYMAMHALPDDGVPPEDAGRYYSFDWGNVHFISLDSNLLERPAASARMLKWLEADLASQNRLWKVVYFHHPPYPTGRHVGDPICAMARSRVLPILERHEVHLVFSGHEHSYQRTLPLRNGAAVRDGPGTVYVITGGGGGGLYGITSPPIVAFGQPAHHYLRGEVRGSRLTITAIGLNGEEIDRFTLAPPARISVDAVVNSATYRPAVAPGSLISIFGQDLALGEAQASSLPLPITLAGTTVSLNGQRLPLLFVSPEQINAQLPFGGPVGRAMLRVSTPEHFVDTPILISGAAPAVFHVPNGSGIAPAVVQFSGVLVSASSPAVQGEYVTIYLTGLGPVGGKVAAGEAVPVGPPLNIVHPVEVWIGKVCVTPSFAGLAPGLAGVYQLNLMIPEYLPGGSYTLRILVNGLSSDPVSLPVSSAVRSGQ